MKKLTRKSLEELAMMLPVVENEIQTSFVGGGNGESITKPYTSFKYEDFGEQFTDGLINTPDGVYYVAEPSKTYSNDISASYYFGGSPETDYSEYYGLYNDSDTGGFLNWLKSLTKSEYKAEMSWSTFSSLSFPTSNSIIEDVFNFVVTKKSPLFEYMLKNINDQLNGLRNTISPNVNTNFTVTFETSTEKDGNGLISVMKVTYYHRRYGWRRATSTRKIL